LPDDGADTGRGPVARVVLADVGAVEQLQLEAPVLVTDFPVQRCRIGQPPDTAYADRQDVQLEVIEQGVEILRLFRIGASQVGPVVVEVPGTFQFPAVQAAA
jgi:hypothetical protein